MQSQWSLKWDLFRYHLKWDLEWVIKSILLTSWLRFLKWDINLVRSNLDLFLILKNCLRCNWEPSPHIHHLSSWMHCICIIIGTDQHDNFRKIHCKCIPWYILTPNTTPNTTTAQLYLSKSSQSELIHDFAVFFTFVEITLSWQGGGEMASLSHPPSLVLLTAIPWHEVLTFCCFLYTGVKLEAEGD